jgi:hypothetical protein
MTDYIIRVTQLTIAPAGEPIFSETATQVTIQDEAAGEYLEITQQGGKEGKTIMVNPDEWPSLKMAVETLLDVIKKGEKHG